MPNLLPLVMTTAETKGQDLSFSQAKKIARRLEKRFDAWSTMDPLAYVLHFWDETGELATDNVMKENAARRILEKAAA
ncbi:hypothetical protein ACIGB6_10215 [Paeniglutamicibacter gangotriensis]|uniref:hypothetical protein n=1 Tax=Paeniglutamicibacter gangotriensis TaxID=254787 RepID=UPI0037C7C732